MIFKLEYEDLISSSLNLLNPDNNIFSYFEIPAGHDHNSDT